MSIQGGGTHRDACAHVVNICMLQAALQAEGWDERDWGLIPHPGIIIRMEHYQLAQLYISLVLLLSFLLSHFLHPYPAKKTRERERENVFVINRDQRLSIFKKQSSEDIISMRNRNFKSKLGILNSIYCFIIYSICKKKSKTKISVILVLLNTIIVLNNTLSLKFWIIFYF